MYLQTSNKDNQGDTYYKAPNRDFGATFTWYLKEAPKTKKEIRKDKEKELFKEGKPIPQPTWRELELEEKEEKPHLIFTIYDSENNVVRQITQSPSKGINQLNWDLRYQMATATNVTGNFSPVESGGRGGRRGGSGGILVMPGKYKVDMQLWQNGELKKLADPVEFTCRKLDNTSLPAADYNENVQFARQVSKLAIAMQGSNRLLSELTSKVENMKQAIYTTPGASQDLMNRARKLAVQLEELSFKMNGVSAKASAEETPPAQVPLNDRLGDITYAHMGSTSGITGTEKMNYEVLKEEFPPVLAALKQIVETEIPALEAELNKIGAPWTPGRLPVWKE
jgi:hypothetical protein